MSQSIYPMYRHSDALYGTHGEVRLPLALVEKVRETDKARLLYNIYTDKEAWFPESIFTFHYHVCGNEMIVFLSIPAAWVDKKREFFQCQ